MWEFMKTICIEMISCIFHMKTLHFDFELTDVSIKGCRFH